MDRDLFDWVMLYGVYLGMLVVFLAGVRLIYVSGHRGPYGVERRAHVRKGQEARRR